LYLARTNDAYRARFSGVFASQADTLRKAIGKKIKELLEKKEEILVNGMIQNGKTNARQKKYGIYFRPSRVMVSTVAMRCAMVFSRINREFKTHYLLNFLPRFLSLRGDIDRISFLITKRVAQTSIYCHPISTRVRFIGSLKNAGTVWTHRY
jgi:hypothetical protein